MKFEIQKDDRTGLIKFEGSFEPKDIFTLTMDPSEKEFFHELEWDDPVYDILRGLAIVYEAYERMHYEEPRE